MALFTTLAVTTHILCVLCTKTAVATGNTMATTSSRGMWTINGLYDSLPPTLSPRQNDRAPQTPNTMVMEKEEDKKTPVGTRPQSTGHKLSGIGGGNHCVHYNTPRPGHCLYYTEPLQCWEHIQSRGLNWLCLAREYNVSFDYDFPDTCHYTTNAFRCTVSLPGHLATILRTLTFYDLHYQMKVSDRGPYGLHLDFILNLNDVANLMDLFSTESTLQFQQQVWDYEESIYKSLKTEVYGLPQVPYDCRDLRLTFYAFFARVSNQLDWPNDGNELQQISVLECRRPLTRLDEYLNYVNTRRVSGMPSEIHQQPSKIHRDRGKRSASKFQSPLQSVETKPHEHIYTEATSESEYLLPNPMHAPSTCKHLLPAVPGGVPRKHEDKVEVPQPEPRPRGDEPVKNIFSKWLTRKNIGTV